MHQETLNKLHALKLKCREGSKRSVCLANERERSGSCTHFEVRTTAATDAARLAVVGGAAAVDAGRAVRTPRGRTRVRLYARHRSSEGMEASRSGLHRDLHVKNQGFHSNPN